MPIGIHLSRSNRNFARVWKRDRGICRYCGEEGESVDHILPWAFRPDNSVGNLVVSCLPCNLTASDKVFPSFEAKRDWLLERRRINDAAEQRAIEAAWDAVPLVVDGPGELVVQDAIWGDPEEGEEEYVPLPAEQLTAERWTWPLSADASCGAPTKKGRPCRIPADECQIHGRVEATVADAREAEAAREISP